MKYSTLVGIVQNEAYFLKENAGYSGAWDDGGSSGLIRKLDDFKNKLVVQEDLRPSEFYKLDDMDIGEPEEFTNIIEKHKLILAKNIAKNIKL